MNYFTSVVQKFLCLSFIIVIVVSTADDENLPNTDDEQEGCVICSENYPTVSLSGCNHKMCNSCVNRMLVINKCTYKCPRCLAYISDFINAEPDTRNICYTCEKEPMAVEFHCKYGHKMCNNCAYRYYHVVKRKSRCPYCNLSIEDYSNQLETPDISIVDGEACLCKSEVTYIVLKPCNHRIGSTCGYYALDNIFVTNHCPKCNKIIKNYKYLKEQILKNSQNKGILKYYNNIVKFNKRRRN
ncbi:uncharacterized protein LOC126894796 isoform X2 [Daktulosphaira vitifoliae]|uniref:uncharacterized protein LOC126894796 isoform X2 n=1 Tax=Daktulosphaira vitifoliae TaxID=58002 RepID=UPI0021AA8D3B|nr:uncharacterized protein LOC126894796 isoform X2 [Daktulosphaira vitifoliae]